MCSCIIKNCQYDKFFDSQEFIQDKKLYYVKDSDSLDKYCLFHAPVEVKEKFTYYQNELFKKIILEYIEYSTNSNTVIDFANAIFHTEFDIVTEDIFKNEQTLNIDFTKTVFLKYFRMDNLKCNNLIFKDTEFHGGGGIKNRNGEDNVNIKNLEFRPYQLETDFVIDIGQYANKEGLLEESTGTIENIRFENHKEGNGIIYFIGFKEKLKEANFRNMILDNVSFQNCDLSKCYFLNAKINETEFRNCDFNQNKDFNGNKIINYASLLVLVVGALMIYTNGNDVYSILLYIFSMLFLLTITLNSHQSIYDEQNMSFLLHNNKKNTRKSISETYRSLRYNLSKNDYQRAGDFFYSQRLTQLLTTDRKYDKFLYFFHYLINGFGENFLRPLIMFLFLIVVFSGYYHTNKDFIATDTTPQFLLVSNKSIDNNMTYYKNQFYLDENKTVKQRQYKPQMLLYIDNNNTNFYFDGGEKYRVDLWERFKVKLIYSASQFISPIVSKNRAWFKTVSSKAAIYNFIETILLYLFFGAFILALKNRIKR